MVQARVVEAEVRVVASHVPIPMGRDPQWVSRAVWVARSSPSAESFRHLALRVRRELGGRPVSSILVTSALPGDGKTLTACNLALAFASLMTTERVALVELDLRVPRIAAAFGLRPRVGIGEVLRGAAPLRAAAVATDAALDIYPVVARCPAAHQLLSRPELAVVVKQLEASYRWVICDTAPALLVPDVQIIAPHLGACLGVVRAGRTPRSALRDLAERLPREKTLGFFLNEARAPRHTRRYYGSAYYTMDDDSADETP